MSRHFRLIAVCAALLANAGCSNEHPPPTAPTAPSPAGPTGPAPPQSSSNPQRLAALTLMEAVIVHKALTTSPLTFAATFDGKVRTDGPCVTLLNGIPQIHGSLQISLDGGLSPTSGTLLPTGSHTYGVSFSNCLVDYLSGTVLNGVASAAYRASDWSNLTATVSADSLRGTNLTTGEFSELADVTADGSAVWTSAGSSTTVIDVRGGADTYTPATGSRLVNNSTTNGVATFGGGSYSTIQSSAGVERRFDNLEVAINGTEYTLTGSLHTTYGSSRPTYTGEIRIITNGTLAARIYGGAADSALTVEVLVPLIPL